MEISEINNMILAALCCVTAFIMYIQTKHSSNITNKRIKNILIVMLVCLGFFAYAKLTMIFAVIFLSFYMSDLINTISSSFKEGYEEKYEEDTFDEAVNIANDEQEYHGTLNFPNYDEDMSKFKIG